VTQAQRRELTNDVVGALPLALRIGRHYDGMAYSAGVLTQLQQELEPVADQSLRMALLGFREEARRLLAEAATAADITGGGAAQVLDAWDEKYRALKALILQAGSERRLPISQMVSRLDEATAIRRMVQQSIHAAAHSHQLGKAVVDGAVPAEAEVEAEEPALEPLNDTVAS